MPGQERLAGHNLRLCVDSSLAGVSTLEAACRRFAAAAGMAAEHAADLTLAVHEAAWNAVLHGNRSRPGTHVEAILKAGPKDIEVQIVDQGRGFDSAAQPDPRLPERLWLASGRGLLLMETLVDDVLFANTPEGFAVTLRKRVHRRPGA